MRRLSIIAAAVLQIGCAAEGGEMDAVRVVLHTEKGDITVAVDPFNAPVSTCNFLRYATDGAYDGGSFFRTVVRETNANPDPIDVIQAATPRGSDDDSEPPIPLERTTDSGLSHVAGTISMARNGPDTATSSFFLVVEDTPSLDFGGARNPDGQGFAAFGHVTSGMDVVRAIHAMPATDEQLNTPIRIRSAELIDELPGGCNT